MTWALISTIDNSWVSGPLEDEPTPDEAQRAIEVALGYPDTCLWSATRNGFVDVVTTTDTITIAAFMLLFTPPERIAIRAARASDPIVDDFWELLLGCTSGIALAHPVVAAGLQHLAAVGLITVERAAAVVAGTSPPA